MTFNTKLVLELHKVLEATTDLETKEQLLNLWKNCCHYGRAVEAINTGAALHGEAGIAESKAELNNIMNATSLTDKVINQ